MRPRVILIASAGLNAALVAALLWAVLRRHQPAGPTPDDTATTQPAGPVQPRVVVRRQFFSWQEVEAADYPTYLKNLRDIGCPEQTIRDIIIADVNQLYARKRLTEIITADQQWWRADPDETVQQAAAAKSQALDQERRALLTALLGPDWESSTTGPQLPGIILNGPILGELSPEIKLAVIDISTRSQQRVAAYMAAQSAAGKTADLAEIARIRLDARNELMKLLNPTQLEEFLLRYSQTASTLRRDFRGFDVTPDEFRKVFRNIDPIEQQLAASATGDTPSIEQQRAALQKQREEAIRNTLGADRYQEYRMARDPAYRDAVLAVQSANAPADVITNLYALNQATAQEFDRIRGDTNMTPEDKAVALKNAQDQLKAARDQLLGLAPPPAPPATPSAPLPTHTYVPGETIDVIANNFGVSPDALRAANPNVDFTQLARGAQIKIPRPQTATQ